MTRPRALDLFCGAGGASEGLHRAGFDVYGVDIKPQPRYPHPGRFTQANALAPPFALRDFDFIWASPPCQAYSVAAHSHRLAGKIYADLIEDTRSMLKASGRPWVIENVVGAPIRKDIVLDGTMFPELRVIRTRWFEISGFWCMAPTSRYQRRLVSHHGYTTVVGGGICSGTPRTAAPWHTDQAKRDAMGIHWMRRAELNQAIPPAYSEFIGGWVMRHLGSAPGEAAQ